MKSLNSFPTAKTGFDHEDYVHDVRTDVCAESPYTGTFGLELELEGRRLPEMVRLPSIGGSSWTAHVDGSLRNGGMEYVLNQPCKRADVTPLVDQLFAHLKAQGAIVANTTRCSTHVHINMKGVKINGLASFVSTWGIFEDVLSLWCGDHRSGNHFALRFSDSSWIVDAWVTAFKTGDFRFNRERRYLGLNSACLSTFGSLEVRTMRGADTAAEVEMWVDMLDRMRVFSRSIEDPTLLAGMFSGDGSRLFAERVFGPDISNVLRMACEQAGEDFDRLIRSGFRRVQPIIFSLPWTDVITAVKRPYIPNPFGAPRSKAKASFADALDPIPAPRIRR